MSRLSGDFPRVLRGRDDDDEGLFTRDLDGQLVRLDAPTEEDYKRKIKLKIDGRDVEIEQAQPLKDSQGNIVRDKDGNTTPRYTTIYDAACQLKGPNPIPTLCHLPHMTPVAVCRMCLVQIYGMRNKKPTPERKLYPACQYAIKEKEGMEVFTIQDPGDNGDRVRRAVNALTELLAGENLKPSATPELTAWNELKLLADKYATNTSRFKLELFKGPAPALATPLDNSSPVFTVDREACILCDRCSRACDEVKKNDVIGRSGKGASAHIGFDLDQPMGESSCVQCGECMVSCPTSAITFKPVARVKIAGDKRSQKYVSAADLLKEDAFNGVPPKFLLWQEGLVVQRQLEADEYLCHQGDPGASAYLLKSGKYEVRYVDSQTGKITMRRIRTPRHFMVGEMACLGGTPRNADIVALEGGEVWEIRRNVLDRMIRSPQLRTRLEKLYRRNALVAALYNSDLFRNFSASDFRKIALFLRRRISFVRVNPGQLIFKQNDWADALYLVRLGHIRVGIAEEGRELNVHYCAPGSVFGEIGLLAILPDDAKKSVDQIDRALAEALEKCPDENLCSTLLAGQRSATCSALDHVELVRIERTDFLQLVRDCSRFRRNLIEISLGRLAMNRSGAEQRPLMRQYIEQGLYEGQSLLVLDLDRCTRCGECVRACVQQHGRESHGAPISRLLLEGKLFADRLVATSCRSCKDAYCMIGCPVDAIHRGKHQQIVIEDHCIGCGLCSSNCPYENIWMVPNENHKLQVPDPASPGTIMWKPQLKAATCDLCDAEGKVENPEPRCVYACPHDAAHRYSGEGLFKIVSKADGAS
jgi:Fe-S-cluster-containing hydrogenase component 2